MQSRGRVAPIKKPVRRFGKRRRRHLGLRFYGLAVAACVAAAGLTLQGERPAGSAGLNAPAVQSAPGSAACSAVQVTRVYDGDTVTVVAGGHSTRVRLLGLDAPEIGEGARCQAEAEGARRARDRLQVMIQSARDLRLCVGGEDRYGRVLAKLLLDGQDAAERLVGEGLARPYHGGSRAGWCG